jgi:hypothetical protein
MTKHRELVIAISIFLFTPFAVRAQGFVSGSTGADGALDLASMNCPGNICTVQLPASGVLNYTTVNVPSGKILQFAANSRNTPVIILAQGDVTISNVLTVSAQDGGFYQIPGPGGFYGGEENNGNGFGPGGGTVNGHREGQWVGPLSLSPIVGGSGGAGGCTAFNGCHRGGGGGGAITIASSTSITVSSEIRAIGGGDPSNYGGPGAGGAIRLVANSINVSGLLNARGANLFGNNAGGNGVIRLEAPSLQQINFTGTSQPAAVMATITGSITTSSLPSLTITSIGGHAVPSYAGARFDTVDLLLPNQLPDPISVSVHAVNVPPGTQVVVGFVQGSSQATSAPGTLSGTFESSTATCGISGLNRNEVTYLLATAIFDPPAAAMNFNPEGRDRVAKVRLESLIATKPKVLFLRADGTVIDQAKLPRAFLERLGL